MRMLILAAGYATRLYPLTVNFPKLLLEVKGITIIDHMFFHMDCEKIKQIVVVRNHKFVEHFEEWRSKSPFCEKLVILDDGSTTNDSRVGAVKDIEFSVNEQNITDVDTMNMPGSRYDMGILQSYNKIK